MIHGDPSVTDGPAVANSTPKTDVMITMHLRAKSGGIWRICDRITGVLFYMFLHMDYLFKELRLLLLLLLLLLLSSQLQGDFSRHHRTPVFYVYTRLQGCQTHSRRQWHLACQ